MSEVDPAEVLSLRAQKIVEEFLQHKSWEDRYKLLIEYGKKHPQLASEKQTEISLVKGCQSQVWLHGSLNSEGKMELEGDSDALLVRGLVALILKVYSGAAPGEVLKFQPKFLEEIGFQSNLSPNRANGLRALLKQIYLFAQVFEMSKQRM